MYPQFFCYSQLLSPIKPIWLILTDWHICNNIFLKLNTDLKHFEQTSTRCHVKFFIPNKDDYRMMEENVLPYNLIHIHLETPQARSYQYHRNLKSYNNYKIKIWVHAWIHQRWEHLPWTLYLNIVLYTLDYLGMHIDHLTVIIY